MNESIYEHIRVVNIDRVLPFEWYPGSEIAEAAPDTERTVVRNPYPVIRRDDRFLLLDDTRALEWLRQKGVLHVPVQLCRPEQTRLLTRRLALTGFTAADMQRLAGAYPEQIRLCNEQESYPPEFLQASIQFAQGEPQTLLLRHSTRTGCPTPLDYLFRAVLDHGRYAPMLEPTSIPETPFKVIVPDAWLTLPSFTLEDLWSAAQSGRLFPTEIVEVRMSGRVVNIDFPMSVLEADLPIEEKEAFLKDLILYRRQSCRTACIEGPVYMLNR